MSRELMMAKRSDGRGTFKGKPITDELLEELADEAERGYDLSKLKRRPGRPPIGSGPADVVPVRLDPELRAHRPRVLRFLARNL